MSFYREVLFLLLLNALLVATHIVDLPQGRVRGAVFDNYYSFTNLRYADRPGRFEAAVPYKRTWMDVFDATRNIRSCVQFGRGTNASDGEEDCLTLNVYTPKLASVQTRLPVFIYIHGGGFMFGSSSFYSPNATMAQGNMVVVSINYRVGPFGFLSTGDGIIQGNFGLKDQLLALRWIKRNIHFFGGDPERILLGGQSAGAASVHFHILRKETESLISAAVGFSGSALNPWVMQLNIKEKAKTLANHLKCPVSGHEMKACLQSRSIEDIHAAVLKMHYFLDNPFNIFGPIIESIDTPDPFITDEPRNLIYTGHIANVPFMATFVTEDGSYNCGSLLRKNAKGIPAIEELNDRWLELAPYMLFYYDEESAQTKQKISERLKDVYMGDLKFSQDIYLILQQMFTDVLYVNGIREMIDLHRMSATAPVYGYVYANPHNYGVANFLAKDLEYQFGTQHGDDLELILPLNLSTNYTMAKNDATISRLMIGMLESFVSNGVPQFHGDCLPANGNNDGPMQYLQIFQEKYCVGPWESFSYQHRDCIDCPCFDYLSSRLEGNQINTFAVPKTVSCYKETNLT